MPRGVPGRFTRTMLDKTHPMTFPARGGRLELSGCTYRHETGPNTGRECGRTPVADTPWCECHGQSGKRQAEAARNA